jgi:hypothetical protein
MSTRVGKGEEFTFSPPPALFRFGCIEAGAHDYGVMSNGQKVVCINPDCPRLRHIIKRALERSAHGFQFDSWSLWRIRGYHFPPV